MLLLFNTNIGIGLKDTSLFPKQLVLLDSGAWQINTFVAKNLMLRLNEATESTSEMYGMDINVTSRMAIHILRYENTQSGLNLTHTQDRNFLQVSGQKKEKTANII